MKSSHLTVFNTKQITSKQLYSDKQERNDFSNANRIQVKKTG